LRRLFHFHHSGMKWNGTVSHDVCTKLKSLEPHFLSFDWKAAIFL
jgi:hypothetical protein